ncbi:A/G-specific adenine glycosylase [Breznakia sp. PF5-3]|uniref:A/G-specific adenine glycosylase n=1 Tax=unclassified Breznakia TaxID=2623764 RepID=UPI00240734BF|nr:MULTISPECIES: A/G-specific adenine glycosylase [unclassified Breznakia]MDF9824856.1 A/G-specific adenine glycosylase [Breznakia sp. PM6-1]MDF9835713.1 A/G-specific adenine glycosylase [Breznakia sp. PF5-3]MDF9838273.1 A/G-specific adenine glycosylase [Breznakia sp. PFB2-8]MDF9860288.1 A/G-specific adenine glycosylase [Breznakia sp. PH5-24]
MRHNKETFTENLLQWYDENARILPWRSEPTPYRVWVSEIMLQQTRVEAVRPYFERFMKAFPSLYDLAEATDEKLHKMWEGLGYYNRVKNMKKCAIVCVEQYDGKLPSDYEMLLTLPGIGSYTAGAIASIAFKQPVAAVDGNVLRVFSRVLVSEDDILKEATKKKFQTIIKSYIPKNHADAFNQALMEIGALICVPNAAPRCNICPLAKDCLGYQSGKAPHLPNKSPKKRRRIEKRSVFVFVYKNKLQIQKREDKGLLAGLYEFPNINQHYTKKALEEYVVENYPMEKIIPLTKAKHIFSHIEWHMKGYLIVLEKPNKGLFITIDELETMYALPTAFKVYCEAVIQYLEDKNETD